MQNSWRLLDSIKFYNNIGAVQGLAKRAKMGRGQKRADSNQNIAKQSREVIKTKLSSIQNDI
jgi:hypothetical protein